jgi:hypothetical protein
VSYIRIGERKWMTEESFPFCDDARQEYYRIFDTYTAADVDYERDRYDETPEIHGGPAWLVFVEFKDDADECEFIMKESV